MIRILHRKITVFGIGSWVALLLAIFGIPSFVPTTQQMIESGNFAAAAPVLGYGLLFLLVLSWGLIAWREFVYAHKARYAEASPNLHQAFHSLRDAYFAVITNGSDDQVMGLLRQSLQSAATVFTTISGVNCRMCIKDLYCADPKANPPERGFITKDLCRSDRSVGPMGTQNELDWITENSDFYLLFADPQKKYFFSNNLPKLAKRVNYKNSHWDSDVYAEKKFPYNSTIVWPIRKCLEGDIQGFPRAHPWHDTLGYLCLDSKSKNVFNERYDSEIGMAYADALYSFIKILSERGSLPDDTTNQPNQEEA